MSTTSRSPFYNIKIRTKLLTMISCIIVFALGLMIYLATTFFTRDTETSVQASNLKLAELTALKVKGDFTSIIDRMGLIGEVMRSEFRSKEQRALFSDYYFLRDHDFYLVAEIIKKDDGAAFKRSVANKEHFPSSSVTPETVAASAASNRRLARVFDGETVIENVSDVFGVPAICIAVPSKDGASALAAYFSVNELMGAFRSEGVSELFLVNGAGDLIAHPKSSAVLARGNYHSLPIVSNMLVSRNNNGLSRFVDENGRVQIGAFTKVGIGNAGVVASADKDRVFASVYRIQRWNIAILVIMLTLAVLAVFFFSKTITSPIIRLADATKEIEKGNFIINIAPRSGDEVGSLTESFVRMGKGLEDRERLKNAFGQFVNKEIAERVMRGEIKLGGERKNVAVFFSDIRSFTAISEKLAPEEVVEFLNEYMTRMVTCIGDTNGFVNKFIGDAIMAVWGAPTSHGNDTENALRAALAMRAAIKEFNKGRGSVKKPVIKFGSGINTGDVLAGQIGSEHRFEYTVIGDTVNFASRIETLTKPFGVDILVSEASYKLVEKQFRFEPMQKIKVKGKAAEQQIYTLLSAVDDPTGPKSLDELRDLLGIDIKGKPVADLEEEKKYEILDK